jgi:hypothetical protein
LLSALRAWSADCVSPPIGLVAWWPGQGNANDIAGTNNGTLHNGVAFAPGKVGQAFIFNGTNSYVEVPDSPTLRLTNELTIEFWVQRQNLQADDVIIEKGGDFTRGVQNYGVGILSAPKGNYLSFWFAGGVRESISITDLNWHHIAVVARNGDADPTFYVDGAPQPVTYRQGPGTLVLYPSTAPLHIGAQVDSINGWNYYSKALVDEGSIYSRALAVAEIQAIYSAGSAGKCVPPSNCIPPPSGLVAWWPGQGSANDIAGTNDGVLEGGVAFAAGEVGQAFSFNGTSSYFQVPDSPSLRLTNELTIEFWVQRQDLQANDEIIEKGGDYTRGVENYGVALASTQWNNDLVFLFAGGTRHSTSITDLNWHHIAVVARNGDADPTFYVDGVPQPIKYRQGPGTIVLYPSTAPVHIGAQVDPISGWYYYSKALVDDVSIYNRALAAAEIQTVYNAGSAGKCAVPFITAQPRSQVGYWGKSVTLTVIAAGNAPLSYQWLKNGTPVVGASGSSLVLTNLQLTDAGNYSVVVTNAYGSTTSSNAYLTMNPAGVSLALYSGVTIDGVVGLTYGIQYSTDLSNTNGWRGMANVTLGTPTELWFDVQPASQSHRYYRVVPGPIPVP